MKKLLLFLSAAAITFASCGETKSLPTDESILWRISGNGLLTPSYLLGTHHFAPVTVLDGYPAYTEALHSVDRIVGEVDMGVMEMSQVMILEAGTLPDSITYHDLLTDEEYRRLDKKLTESFGVGLAYFGTFKPAMISTMYAAVAYIKANPSFNPVTHVPIDSYIQDRGREQGKHIIGLETAEEQIELLFNFEPLETQAATLLCIFEHDEETTEQLKTFDQLYKEGRLRELYEISMEKDDEPCSYSEEFEAALLRIRNNKWIEQLPGIMAEGPSFIAVGALHLPGEEGLINRLRESGYTVEPIR